MKIIKNNGVFTSLHEKLSTYCTDHLAVGTKPSGTRCQATVKFRDDLAKNMITSQVQEAQRLAREFKLKKEAS